MANIFNFIKAAKFFPMYTPEIKDWKKKMTGKNGRGNPIEFSEAEKIKIRAALKLLLKDLQYQLKDSKKS